MSNKIYFAENLKYLRKSKQLTQKKLADILGIKRAKLSHLETGNREPNLKDLSKICDFFQLDIEILSKNLKTGKNYNEIISNSKYPELNDTNKELADNMIETLYNYQNKNDDTN